MTVAFVGHSTRSLARFLKILKDFDSYRGFAKDQPPIFDAEQIDESIKLFSEAKEQPEFKVPKKFNAAAQEVGSEELSISFKYNGGFTTYTVNLACDRDNPLEEGTLLNDVLRNEGVLNIDATGDMYIGYGIAQHAPGKKISDINGQSETFSERRDNGLLHEDFQAFKKFRKDLERNPDFINKPVLEHC